jgi:uncharacterized phage protein (TIGR02216 family)
MTQPAFTPGARRLAGQAAWLLGWRPDDFWRATPDELADALGALHEAAGAPAVSIDRAAIDLLMERYPDDRG